MDKQEKMKVALSKLTIEEQELLGLTKKPKVKKLKVKKNYKLKIYYMIGDADGHTDEEAVISLNNPFLKHITKALGSLGDIEGYWGVALNKEHYDGNKKIGNINEFEYDLLCLLSDYNYNKDTANEFLEKYEYEQSEQNHDYLREFDGLLISDTEYSFLTFEDYKLK